ncbi:uncharacterized protein LOC125778205 [Bactrocera dorsalis]|uniref:Uncharacterized protein LOC125778205 n=1 Tax=Bactrocera dorsalis TaxID=27457 RepID=A0ABM3JNH8_BACDO|nr:uncharacterized protein LOC125778205 [Bactrocera dorsalis]
MPRRGENFKIMDALCKNQALNLIILDSSDDEDADEIFENFSFSLLCLLNTRRSVHLGVPKSSQWRHNVLRHFDDSRFNEMIRVGPDEFCRILNYIKDDSVFNTNSSGAQLPLDLQLKIVLFRLGSSGDGLSIRKVASLFGVGDGGTIQIITKRVFKAILKLKEKFLFWPNENERLEIVTATRKEMPGCIGYIDGSELKLAEAPAKKHELFYSRKRQYAIKMQAVCDYRLRIRQVTIGYPGSVHDAKIFLNSPLAKHPQRFLSDSQWIAGDSAYPLKEFLLTPFRQNSTDYTTEERESFNKYFSKYRVRIENCFGILKEKFGSLKELKFRMINEQNKKECNDWIMVCCILHNMLINFQTENEESVEINPPQYSLPPGSNTRSSLLNFIQNHRLT